MLKDLIKSIQELGIFTGVVLTVTLLFNIACIQAFEGLPEATYFIQGLPEFMYSYLFFSECLFFVAAGMGLIYFSLFRTTETERYTLRPIGHGMWTGESKRVHSQIVLSKRDVRLRLIKGSILVIIGVLFLILFLYNIHLL